MLDMDMYEHLANKHILLASSIALPKKVQLQRSEFNCNKSSNFAKPILLSMLLSTCALADQNTGTEPLTYPLEIGTIITIKINGIGLTAPTSEGTQNDCDQFILTEQEVKDFFNATRTVREPDYRHMLDWSPCYVKGSLTLADGSTASWAIHRFRAGSLILNSGETIYLYCPQCRGTAFHSL